MAPGPDDPPAPPLLDTGVSFDALFALNDALGLGALFALRRRGVRVLEDVAVIGFDNVDDAVVSTPSPLALTRTRIAQTAAALVLIKDRGVWSGSRPITSGAGRAGTVRIAMSCDTGGT